MVPQKYHEGAKKCHKYQKMTPNDTLMKGEVSLG